MKGIILVSLLAAILLLSGCASNPGTPEKAGGNLTITPNTLPKWISGRAGSADLAPMVSKGTPPYSCSLTAGSVLPNGLVLDSNCTISGTHTLAPGTPEELSPPFTVRVSDSSQPQLFAEVKLAIITVVEKPELIPVDGACTAGQYCRTQVARAQGGTPEYVFSSGSFADGAPPMGMSVGTDGFLVGTPKDEGTFTFSVCVADSVRASDCGDSHVIVSPAPENQTPAGGCTSPYDGVWSGTVEGTGVYYLSGDYETNTPYSVSYDLEITLKCNASEMTEIGKITYLEVMHMKASDSYFGCTGGCDSTLRGENQFGGINNYVDLPEPGGNVYGMNVLFPNSAMIDVGMLSLSQDGKTIIVDEGSDSAVSVGWLSGLDPNAHFAQSLEYAHCNGCEEDHGLNTRSRHIELHKTG
ncbi:MAG: hypothetical protein NT157_01665 [Candidatus Micrarchaeota archaeon]|nr:hypothetical protein [Candidatus Micrarchaeota archaeon]